MPDDRSVHDYRHDATRKNNPPAGLAAQGKVQEPLPHVHRYDPHLPPALRFDQTGEADALSGLLHEATQRPLSADEAQLLLRHTRPWLEWTGKREKHQVEVDPVALHVHERVSAQAVVRAAQRQDVQRDLFADPQLSFGEAVRFYEHDIDWANRLILGDSLQVMASLARREGMAGKVQMIYLDPPYGIKFKSNFQPKVGDRSVGGNSEKDLTREPEMVKAYRDTWRLGIHSYLDYLRDRLVLARDMLSDTGSLFMQIGDENVHRVRALIDEVFGPENFVGFITFVKTSSDTSGLLGGVADYLIWFAKDAQQVKYHQLYKRKKPGQKGATDYKYVELPSGERRSIKKGEDLSVLPNGSRIFTLSDTTSQRPAQEGDLLEFEVEGRTFTPGRGTFKTNEAGMERLVHAGRIHPRTNSLRYVRYLDDFAFYPIQNVWNDTIIGHGEDKTYVVQTFSRVIERCLLMTTDPGDLVLDPTCGSGTTAFAAERWGRRWITVDTSRVAVALARQRLLTGAFPYFAIQDSEGGPSNAVPRRGFVYETGAPRHAEQHIRERSYRCHCCQARRDSTGAARCIKQGALYRLERNPATTESQTRQFKKRTAERCGKTSAPTARRAVRSQLCSLQRRSRLPGWSRASCNCLPQGATRKA